jgi:NAD(P)-dependent dehydrogenase (short-subunit alcohol dehydrogenase family)
MSGPRIAAVTGASRGIGRAIVLELAHRGYRVFALARSSADLEELATEAPGAIHPILLDVADDDSRRAATQAVLDATSGYGLDVVVNNAGYGQLGPLEEVSVDKLRRQLEVNVVGVLGFTQPFIPLMRARRSGTIVNVSSIAGRMATPFTGAYNASKFALEGMSDALRLELVPFGIRVIIVAPGPIGTNFGAAAGEVAEESPTSPYAPFTRRWRGARKGSNLFTRSPAFIARLVADAVEREHPRPRYTVTLPAKLGAVARRVVPDTVTDWALRRTMGLQQQD